MNGEYFGYDQEFFDIVIRLRDSMTAVRSPREDASQVSTYTIIIATGPLDLVKQVEESQAYGWIPIGGLCIIQSGLNEWKFYQAMVKGEAKPKVTARTPAKATKSATTTSRH